MHSGVESGQNGLSQKKGGKADRCYWKQYLKLRKCSFLHHFSGCFSWGTWKLVFLLWRVIIHFSIWSWSFAPGIVQGLGSKFLLGSKISQMLSVYFVLRVHYWRPKYRSCEYWQYEQYRTPSTSSIRGTNIRHSRSTHSMNSMQPRNTAHTSSMSSIEPRHIASILGTSRVSPPKLIYS